MNVQALIANTSWHPSKNSLNAEPVDVSVLLPTFCRARSGLLTRAIASVLQERAIALELIIVDDGSTDGSAAIIAEFMQADPRVSCLRHPVNIGLPAISEFEAYQRSRGQYFAFAFDDDEFLPDALSQLLQAARKLKAAFVYGHVDIHLPDATTNLPAVLRDFGRGGHAQTLLHSHNFISNNAVLVRRDVLENIGLYDPHIAIARLCDWDLWLRISQSYTLVPVDVKVGRIDGPMRGESLGNTYGVELWLANEWMHLPRNEALRPANFGRVDVLAVPPALSWQGAEQVGAIDVAFRSKPWHVTSKKVAEDARITGVFSPFLGTIAVLVSSYDASITLCFDRLPTTLTARLRVMQFQQWQGTLAEELVGASAIIVARDLFGMQAVIDCAWQLQIPHYYFMDDNFVALCDLPEFRADYGAYTKEAVRAALASFSGVLVSTSALQNYFVAEQLHQQIAVLPPMMTAQGLECAAPSRPASGAPLKLAFIGGAHRAAAFLKFVIPALVKLSAARPLELHLVGDLTAEPMSQIISTLKADAPTVVVIRKPFNYDLDGLLADLQKDGVSILLHPGEDHVNGQFKTLNVLLNAAQIGAIPILSAVAPYTAINDLGIAHVVENSEAAWFSALQFCVDSTQIAMHEKLSQYCALNYGGTASEAVVAQILATHPPVTQVTRDARFRMAMAALKAENRKFNAQLVSRRFIVKRAIKMIWDALLAKLKLR